MKDISCISYPGSYFQKGSAVVTERSEDEEEEDFDFDDDFEGDALYCSTKSRIHPFSRSYAQ